MYNDIFQQQNKNHHDFMAPQKLTHAVFNATVYTETRLWRIHFFFFLSFSITTMNTQEKPIHAKKNHLDGTKSLSKGRKTKYFSSVSSACLHFMHFSAVSCLHNSYFSVIWYLNLVCNISFLSWVETSTTMWYVDRHQISARCNAAIFKPCLSGCRMSN